MPPAVALAGIGAAASIGGAVLGSKAQKKAANTAAAAQQRATDQNNALLRELYGRNTQNFQPYMATGREAMGQINDFLGLRGEPQQPQLYGGQPGVTPSNGGINGGGNYGDLATDGIYMGDGGPDLSALYGGQSGQQQPQGTVTTQAPGGSAWDTFQNSTYYQHPLREGLDTLGQGWAAQGAYRSGAAMKDAIKFGSDYGAGRLGQWIDLLKGQQNLGFGGAQALAGVSNNYGNNVTTQNSNAADAASNAALLRGQANQSMYGGIASGLGNLAGSFSTSFRGF